MTLTDAHLAEIRERIVRQWPIPRNWLEALVSIAQQLNDERKVNTSHQPTLPIT